MRIATLAAAVMLALLITSANAKTEFQCLEEAALAESTLAKEPIEADKAVVYSILRKVADGRWGDTACEVVYKRYTATRTKTVTKRSYKNGRRVVRWISKTTTKTVCVFSFACMPKYAGILKRASNDARQQARLAVMAVLSGEYAPPPEIAQTLQYMFRKYASQNGALWFDCTGKELGKADPESVHVHYRDQTDEELTETLQKKPECTRFIQIFRNARDKNNKRQQVFASR